MWYRILMVLFLGSSTVTPAIGDTLSTAETLLLAQRIRPDAAQLQQAKRLLLVHMHQEPAVSQVWLLMAWARMVEHRFAEALELATIADHLEPDEARILALMSDALTELGRYDEAVAVVQHLMDIKPGVMAWIRAARLRFLYNDLEGAIELMARAAASGPQKGERSAWIWLRLARLRLFEGNSPAAARAIAKAQRAYPGLPTIVRMQARLASALGQPESALAFYRQALKIRPNAEDALAAWRIARQLDEQGQVRHLSLLLEGMARLEGFHLSHRALAEFFAESGRTDRAKASARAALAVRPDIYSHAVMARVLTLAGDELQAREHARIALQLNTPDPTLRDRMGAILGESSWTLTRASRP